MNEITCNLTAADWYWEMARMVGVAVFLLGLSLWRWRKWKARRSIWEFIMSLATGAVGGGLFTIALVLTVVFLVAGERLTGWC